VGGYLVLGQPGGLGGVGGTVCLVVGMGGCKVVEQMGKNNSQGTSEWEGMAGTVANVGYMLGGCNPNHRIEAPVWAQIALQGLS